MVFGLQVRRQHIQRLAIDVIDDGGGEEQSSDPPAQIRDNETGSAGSVGHFHEYDFLPKCYLVSRESSIASQRVWKTRSLRVHMPSAQALAHLHRLGEFEGRGLARLADLTEQSHRPASSAGGRIQHAAVRGSMERMQEESEMKRVSRRSFLAASTAVGATGPMLLESRPGGSGHPRFRPDARPTTTGRSSGNPSVTARSASGSSAMASASSAWRSTSRPTPTSSWSR